MSCDEDSPDRAHLQLCTIGSPQARAKRIDALKRNIQGLGDIYKAAKDPDCFLPDLL
jgi:hypothetical protein